MGVALAVLMSVPALASATSVTCAAGDHAVYAADDVTITSCVSGAAWQAAMLEQVARAANHLPVVAVGAVVKDAAGISYTCLPGYVRYDPGCYDLTHTAEYKAQAKLIAEELSGNFGWGYWLTN